jgi:type II secretory pathway pseudopilin PulG
MVLLEVLVALAILGIMGGAVAALAVGAGDSVRRAQRADAEARSASRFFDAVALWPREDLDRRLGSHPQGIWRVEVQRPSGALYTIALLDSSGTRMLLHSALYRPEPMTQGGQGERH